MSRHNPFKFRRPTTGWTFSYSVPASKRYSPFSIVGQGVSRWYGLRMAFSILFARPVFRPRLVSRTLPARLNELRFPPDGKFLGVYQDDAGSNRLSLRLDWPTPNGMQEVAWQLRDLGFIHIRNAYPPVFTFAGRSGEHFVWDEQYMLVVGYDGGPTLQLLPRSWRENAADRPMPDSVPAQPSFTPPAGFRAAPMHQASALQTDHASYGGQASLPDVLAHWLAEAKAQGWQAQEQQLGANLATVHLHSVAGNIALLTVLHDSRAEVWLASFTFCPHETPPPLSS